MACALSCSTACGIFLDQTCVSCVVCSLTTAGLPQDWKVVGAKKGEGGDSVRWAASWPPGFAFCFVFFFVCLLDLTYADFALLFYIVEIFFYYFTILC